MRKKLFLLLFIIPTLCLYSQSKDFSRWSITAEYGYNYFDGDINQNLTALLPASFREVTYGGTVEYAFTPAWGIALEYYYFPLQANNTVPAPVNITTLMHTSSLSATINFTRWIFPETKSPVSFNGTLGVGYSSYTTNPITVATGLPPTNVLLNETGGKVFQAATFPVTFYAEYNFTKPFALGAKIHYRAFNKDNLEGISSLNWKGVTNDYVAAGTVYLRYKFGSLKHDHLRNIRMQDYEPDPGLVLALQVKKEIDELKPRVDNVDKKLNDIDKKVVDLGKKVDELDSKLNELGPKVEKIEKWMLNDGPDTDGDGVIDERDIEPNTASNTPVDFWGKTLKLPQIVDGKQTIQQFIEEIPAVYFDFDGIELDNAALIAISKVYARLKADSTIFVEVRGFCDSEGDSIYNMKLSRRRANVVKQELVKAWGINPNRIIANPYGKVLLPKMKYRPNRRCDFLFSNDKFVEIQSVDAVRPKAEKEKKPAQKK